MVLLLQGGDDTLKQIGVGGTFAVMLVLIVLRYVDKWQGNKTRGVPCGAGTVEYWRTMGETLNQRVTQPLIAALDTHGGDLVRVCENQQRMAELLAGIAARLPGAK